MDLGEVEPKVKSGNEYFTDGKNKLGIQLIEFWKWNQSNLLSNSLRGHLAEFIVSRALKIETSQRVEWDNYDLETFDGRKIEVKSASYIQCWAQSRFSSISFSIKASKGSRDHELYDGNSRRWGDYYIFCLLSCKDQKLIDPLNVNQWSFYVVNTSALDELMPTQKTLSLTKLERIPHIKCDFKDLKRHTI